jgi:hypothetical protein
MASDNAVVNESQSSASIDEEPSSKTPISRMDIFKHAHSPTQKCSQSSVGARVGGEVGGTVGKVDVGG